MLALPVRELPSAIPETKHLCAFGNDLHPSVRRQNHASVTAAQRRPAVCAILCCARHWKGDIGIRLRPLFDVHNLGKESVFVDECQSLKSVTQPIETADRGEGR